MSTPRLSGDRRGATAVEFALLAPVFLLLLCGMIEIGRMLWAKQVLTEVAYGAARCASLEGQCKTAADIRSFATSRAAGWGLKLDPQQVGYTAITLCDGNAGNAQVTLRYALASPIAGLVPGLAGDVEARGCFPRLNQGVTP